MNGPIYLIGYRGVGKSSVAAALSSRIGWPWVDADAVLEQRAGRSIRQIFAEVGELPFRDLETVILKELSTHTNSIIATGGGVILRPENRDILKGGACIWLTAPAEILWQRIQDDEASAEQRPDLAEGGLDEIVSLLQVREPLYRACATRTIDASIHDPDTIAIGLMNDLSSSINGKPA